MITFKLRGQLNMLFLVFTNKYLNKNVKLNLYVYFKGDIISHYFYLIVLEFEV